MVLPMRPKKSRRNSLASRPSAAFPTVPQPQRRQPPTNRRASTGVTTPKSVRKRISQAGQRRASVDCVVPSVKKTSNPLHSVYNFQPEPRTPIVHITGLELLECNYSGSFGQTDYDCDEEEPSFESYAKDSFAMHGMRRSSNAGGYYGRRQQETRRRSSIGTFSNESGIRMEQGTRRRSSIGSFSNDSSFQMQQGTMRRSSIGTFSNDSGINGYGRKTSQHRRRSNGSQANDSVRQRVAGGQRRLSIGSCTNFSVDVGNSKNGRRSSFCSEMENSKRRGYSGNTSSSSMSNHSMDFGNGGSSRRASIESYANDSVVKWNRRGSMDSTADDSRRPPTPLDTLQSKLPLRMSSGRSLEVEALEHKRRLSTGTHQSGLSVTGHSLRSLGSRAA